MLGRRVGVLLEGRSLTGRRVGDSDTGCSVGAVDGALDGVRLDGSWVGELDGDVDGDLDVGVLQIVATSGSPYTTMGIPSNWFLGRQLWPSHQHGLESWGIRKLKHLSIHVNPQ